jgi:hypothetical protein
VETGFLPSCFAEIIPKRCNLDAAAMADLVRMSKTTVRLGERDFPFVVQVAVPDGGFECTLGVIDAWHHHNGNPRSRLRHATGEQAFWSWCFEGLEVAKAVRGRFGGEIMPVALRLHAGSRLDRASHVAAAGKFTRGPREHAAEVRRARLNRHGSGRRAAAGMFA